MILGLIGVMCPAGSAAFKQRAAGSLARGEFSPSTATDAEHRAVVHDFKTADALADALMAGRLPEPAWRRESPMWWLAETKDPRFASFRVRRSETPQSW